MHRLHSTYPSGCRRNWPAGQELKVIRQTGYQERYDWDKIKLVYAPADVVITSKNYTRDIHTAGAFTLGGGLYGERMTDQEVQNDIGALLSMGNTTDSPVKWKWVKVNGYDALAREKTPISHSIVTIEGKRVYLWGRKHAVQRTGDGKNHGIDPFPEVR